METLESLDELKQFLELTTRPDVKLIAVHHILGKSRNKPDERKMLKATFLLNRRQKNLIS
jgi:hypothetical protein